MTLQNQNSPATHEQPTVWKVLVWETSHHLQTDSESVFTGWVRPSKTFSRETPTLSLFKSTKQTSLRESLFTDDLRGLTTSLTLSTSTSNGADWLLKLLSTWSKRVQTDQQGESDAGLTVIPSQQSNANLNH